MMDSYWGQNLTPPCKGNEIRTHNSLYENDINTVLLLTLLTLAHDTV
jgi:hypothetical protein